MPRNPLPPKVEQLRPLAEGLARRIARQPADVDDLIQTGLLAYLSDYKRIQRLVPLHAQWPTARAIVRRAMLGYYGTFPERASQCSEALTEYASDGAEQQTDLLEMNDYLGALERACGHQARVIVENLMAPTGECAVRLLVEIRSKRRSQRDGYSPSNKRVRLSQRAIREAMDLDKQTWAAELQRVRGFTRQWISKTA